MRELEEFSREEQRTRSQIIEFALRYYLTAKRGRASEVVTSPGQIKGAFIREECYDRYFDMQLAATMLLEGVSEIYTENIADFTGIPGIRAVNPLATGVEAAEA